MPKRLFDGEPPGGPERLLLPQAPVLTAEQGLCSLGVCLQAALHLLGREVAYERLLGLLGAAFMLRVEPGLGAELAVVDRWGAAPAVLRGLGWPAEVLCGPEPEAVLAVAEAELRAGRPLLAMGWGAYPLDWALLVGRQGNQLLGRWPDSGPALRAAPWTTGLLLVLGAPTVPAEPRALVSEALERALGHLDDSAAQYAAWIGLLERESPYGPPLQVRERMLGEQWLVQCLVEARAAGGLFIRSAAELFAEDAADLLGEAGERLEGVADDLEALLTTPDAPGYPLLAEDEEWLAARRRGLQRVAHGEAAAREQLAEALRVARGEV